MCHASTGGQAKHKKQEPHKTKAGVRYFGQPFARTVVAGHNEFQTSLPGPTHYSRHYRETRHFYGSENSEKASPDYPQRSPYHAAVTFRTIRLSVEP
jgi:hypothetical protein